MITLRYESTPEFNKDFKRLSKRYRTLPTDLETLKKAAIELLHCHGLDNQSCLAIPGLNTPDAIAYKVKKFACRSLTGGAHSGIRLTYIYFPATRRVLFVEMYYKGDKELENRQRLQRYLL